MEMQRKEQLNEKGLTAYFEQMANADGRVETTVQWLVEIPNCSSACSKVVKQLAKV